MDIAAALEAIDSEYAHIRTNRGNEYLGKVHKSTVKGAIALQVLIDNRTLTYLNHDSVEAIMGVPKEAWEQVARQADEADAAERSGQTAAGTPRYGIL